MSKTLSAEAEHKPYFTTKRMALIGVMTAVTCILGPFSIPLPFSPVPISFTNLAIYLAAYVLGMKACTVSYLIYIVGFFVDHFPGKVALHIVGMVLGLAICYIFGTVWLAGQLNMTFVAGLGVGVIPYLPGDAVKIIFTALIGPKLRREIYRLGE